MGSIVDIESLIKDSEEVTEKEKTNIDDFIIEAMVGLGISSMSEEYTPGNYSSQVSLPEQNEPSKNQHIKIEVNEEPSTKKKATPKLIKETAPPVQSVKVKAIDLQSIKKFLQKKSLLPNAARRGNYFKQIVEMIQSKYNVKIDLNFDDNFFKWQDGAHLRFDWKFGLFQLMLGAYKNSFRNITYNGNTIKLDGSLPDVANIKGTIIPQFTIDDSELKGLNFPTEKIRSGINETYFFFSRKDGVLLAHQTSESFNSFGYFECSEEKEIQNYSLTYNNNESVVVKYFALSSINNYYHPIDGTDGYMVIGTLNSVTTVEPDSFIYFTFYNTTTSKYFSSERKTKGGSYTEVPIYRLSSTRNKEVLTTLNFIHEMSSILTTKNSFSDQAYLEPYNVYSIVNNTTFELTTSNPWIQSNYQNVGFTADTPLFPDPFRDKIVLTEDTNPNITADPSPTDTAFDYNTIVNSVIQRGLEEVNDPPYLLKHYDRDKIISSMEKVKSYHIPRMVTQAEYTLALGMNETDIVGSTHPAGWFEIAQSEIDNNAIPKWNDIFLAYLWAPFLKKKVLLEFRTTWFFQSFGTREQVRLQKPLRALKTNSENETLVNNSAYILKYENAWIKKELKSIEELAKSLNDQQAPKVVSRLEAILKVYNNIIKKGDILKYTASYKDSWISLVTSDSITTANIDWVDGAISAIRIDGITGDTLREIIDPNSNSASEFYDGSVDTTYHDLAEATARFRFQPKHFVTYKPEDQPVKTSSRKNKLHKISRV